MLTVLGLVTVAILLWVMKTRSARRRWVKELDLIGQWDLEGDNPDEVRIEFIGTSGDLGNYMASNSQVLESGSWQLSSYFLILTPLNGEEQRYELRRFGEGLIGIHGPDREHQVFRKKKLSNVIKLHEHHSRNS